jgi:hypothetical protein
MVVYKSFMGNNWFYRYGIAYTNESFYFFTNQKIAIRIFKKGYKKKDAQQLNAVLIL